MLCYTFISFLSAFMYIVKHLEMPRGTITNKVTLPDVMSFPFLKSDHLLSILSGLIYSTCIVFFLRPQRTGREDDEVKGAEIMGYIRDGKIVGRRGRENRDRMGGVLSFGDTAATVELRKFRALQQSVSLSSAALRCGVELQSQHN